MRLTILILVLFVLSSCDFIKETFAPKDDAVEQSFTIDSKGTDSKSLNGEVRYKFPSGKLKSIVTYKDNKKVGISHSFYETGEKQYEIPYVDGKKDGVVSKVNPRVFGENELVANFGILGWSDSLVKLTPLLLGR